MTKPPYLRSLTRLVWVCLTLIVGVIPSFLFFVWIERNMALPSTQVLQWPWISFTDASLAISLAWNASLFFLFGFFHSLLAQRPAQNFVRKLLPAQTIRAFYVCFAGVNLVLMMSFWQNTGVILWVIPGLSAWALSALSMALFYPLLFSAFRVASLFDPLEFLGFRQLYSRPDQIDTMSSGGKVIETGFFGCVRHPIYFFTLLAFLVTPMMSLDRMILFVTSLLYLFVAIPIEERKLIERFGSAYLEYRKRVPAIFPRFH
jgi:protein-S-isoprenylcysteine O-methyltransferase Ste14